MTPFLERLIARSREALPVLQPRRASRFEATAFGGAVEGSVEEMASPSTKPQDPAALVQVPDPSPSFPHAVEAAGPLPLRPAPRPEAPVLPVPAPRRGSSPRAEEIAHVSEPFLNLARPLLSLPKVSPLTPPTEPRTVEPPSEGPFRETRPLLMEPTPPIPLPEPFPAMRREAAVVAAMAPLTPREDVHISIGRIEIRALPAKAASAPRRPQENRPSSLDTYLQQRGGRRMP